jgi:Restriction endonuclease
MTFDHLDDGQFEELTYDLLVGLGFKNVNWRRGTGKGGATADQGRDIVADELRTGIDGATHFDHWFVQCKHYKSGVPPQKLNDALTWAGAERPAVLLIVASDFLSNPAKLFLESYRSNNRPPFQIRLWERKDLERLLASQPGIVRKYGLQPDDPFIDTHPAHLYYMLVPTHNTLDYFFEQIEKIPKKTRDSVFGWPYYAIINPRFREPHSKDEVVGDMMLDIVDYNHFKKKCYELGSIVVEHFLVRSVVLDALTWLWHCSNPRLVAETVAQHQRAIGFFKKQLEETDDPADTEALEGCIVMSQELIDTADERQIKNHREYADFCEKVIVALALEGKSLSPGDA